MELTKGSAENVLRSYDLSQTKRLKLIGKQTEKALELYYRDKNRGVNDTFFLG